MQRVLVPLEIAPAEMSGPPVAADTETLRGRTMGTTWSVSLLRPAALAPASLDAGIRARLDRVVAEMSPWEAGSAISRFNGAPAGSWHYLAPGFFHVLDSALTLAGDSGGAFDPTIGALVDLWGFGPAPGRTTPPADDEIAAARAFGGWQRIILDRERLRARQPGGARVDLSAIAKGYAVDLVAGFLADAGISSFLVEVGGEFRGAGTKPDGLPWWVALEDPPDDGASGQRPAPVVAALHGLAVASSGDYRRFFESGGRHYAHILNPRTGRPATGGIGAVSVLHAECMMADAYATALAVLGAGAGPAYAAARGIAARFLVRTAGGTEEILSPAFAAMLA